MSEQGNKNKFLDILKRFLKKRRIAKKIRLWGIIIIILVGAAIAGTGIASLYSFHSLLDSFYSFFMDQDESVSAEQKSQWIETVTADELLKLLDEGYRISENDGLLIKIDQENFRYLLQKASDYEKQGQKTKTVTVEGYREYLRRVETSGTDSDGNLTTDVSYEPAEEYVYKEITVSNVDTEGMLNLDWRLLYIYSMIRSLDRNNITEEQMEGEDFLEEGDGWIINKSDINIAFKSVAMKYIYAYNVMEDKAIYYDYDRCESLPHLTDTYGNKDSTFGKYTWNYPRSLMESAVSGYSSLTYLLDQSKEIVGIRENYEDERFREISTSLCPLYTYDFFQEVFKFMPGGKRVLEKFENLQHQAEAGNATIYTGYFTVNPGSYPKPEGVVVDTSTLPTFVGSYTGGYSTVGEAAVALARSRLDWKYSQTKRMQAGYWDCSSMICRIYNELGVEITPGGTTLTLKSLAVNKNQIISEEELMPGDAIWYSKKYKETGKSAGYHVMMYSGNGNVIHAKGTDFGTVEEPLVRTGYRGSAKTTVTEMFYFRPYLNLNSTFVASSISSNSITAADLYGKSQDELLGIILDLAVEDAKTSHILPSITAAQFILESGWGKSTLTQKSNNCFGMKISLSGNKWPGSTWDGVSYVEIASNEEENGITVSRLSKFRAYTCVAESYADHSAYLNGAKNGSTLRYAGISKAANYSNVLDILIGGGYATDSSYKSKLTDLIKKYNLDRYDRNYSTVSTNAASSVSGERQEGQKIAFSEFSDDKYASFSVINTGSAIYYKATGNSNGIVVCVNAGHGTSGGESKKTQSHPDGTGKYTSGTNAAGAVMSTAISSGTTNLDGTSEAAINLKVAKN